MIRVAIVDDEPVAREGIRLWLASEPDVEIVGEAGNPNDAIALIERTRPDLLFLDVQMPGGDGFDVVEGIAATHLPEVVFVTAHEENALRAFDVAALDFLLKPVREERFRTALERARRELARGGDERETPARLGALLDHVRGGAGPGRRLERFAVRERDRFVIVKASDVAWIEAAGNYAELHTTAGATHLVRATLADIEARLDPEAFARIHRGTLVRVDTIREVVPASHGDCDVVLTDGTTLKLSRRFRERLLP